MLLTNASPDAPRLIAAYSPKQSRQTGSSINEPSYADDEKKRIMNFEEGSYIQDSVHDHTALGHTDLNNGIQSKADNKQMI